MLELTEASRGVVEALLAAPVAWQSPAELSRAIGLGVEETTDLLAALDAGGWLAAWEREFDVVVTLSVAAASSLGVRLVEVGADEVPRWARPGDRDPSPPKASGVFRGERAAMLGLVADRATPVELAAEQAEEASLRPPATPGARPARGVEALPRPTQLVGSCLTPWPGPGEGRRATCPSCSSRPLAASSYCLYCDRWGLDYLLLELSPPPRVAKKDRRDDLRRRDMEALARKEKRRARRTHQAEAERQLRARSRARAAAPAPTGRDDPSASYPSVKLLGLPMPGAVAGASG